MVGFETRFGPIATSELNKERDWSLFVAAEIPKGQDQRTQK